nr:MAG TPA: hypothetical protein [Caudoviricetes sp.]
MILLDLSDMDIKQYRHELSGETFDFNMDHDLDIKPIAKKPAAFPELGRYIPVLCECKERRGEII